MKRKKAVYSGLTLALLIIGYLAYAFRSFYLIPELEYDDDVPREARLIIDAWYQESEYRAPPSIKSANYGVILMQPHLERLTIPVEYGTTSWKGRLISVELYWEPWVRTIYFSKVGATWQFDHELNYTEE